MLGLFFMLEYRRYRLGGAATLLVSRRLKTIKLSFRSILLSIPSLTRISGEANLLQEVFEITTLHLQFDEQVTAIGICTTMQKHCLVEHAALLSSDFLIAYSVDELDLSVDIKQQNSGIVAPRRTQIHRCRNRAVPPYTRLGRPQDIRMDCNGLSIAKPAVRV